MTYSKLSIYLTVSLPTFSFISFFSSPATLCCTCLGGDGLADDCLLTSRMRGCLCGLLLNGRSSMISSSSTTSSSLSIAGLLAFTTLTGYLYYTYTAFLAGFGSLAATFISIVCISRSTFAFCLFGLSWVGCLTTSPSQRLLFQLFLEIGD